MEDSWDAKFKWSAVSDYFTLYRVMLKFLDDLKLLDRDLEPSIENLIKHFEEPASLHKKVSSFLANKNTQYFKQIQKYLSPASDGNIVFGGPWNQSEYQNFEQKLFR